jgi:hypothetical protein
MNTNLRIKKPAADRRKDLKLAPWVRFVCAATAAIYDRAHALPGQYADTAQSIKVEVHRFQKKITILPKYHTGLLKQ